MVLLRLSARLFAANYLPYFLLLAVVSTALTVCPQKRVQEMNR